MTTYRLNACALLFLSGTLVLPAKASAQISESFADVGALASAAWEFVDNSMPIGVPGWFQGLPDATGFFDARSGASNAYAASAFSSVNLGAAAGPFTLSNWLITPQVPLLQGSIFSFFTRTLPAGSGLPVFPDRLEVRLSASGASGDVGNTAESVGAFDFGGGPLLVINPSLNDDGYPREWTRYAVTLPEFAEPTVGRFAFRHYVTNVGNIVGVNNGEYIGIDDVSYTVAATQVPEPSTVVLLLVGALGLAGVANRRRALN